MYIDIDIESILIFIVSCWLAWHTYEYLQYKALGQFVGRFIGWFGDYESKIWIDGFIMITIAGTLATLVPFVLVLFYAMLITFPYYFFFGI